MKLILSPLMRIRLTPCQAIRLLLDAGHFAFQPFGPLYRSRPPREKHVLHGTPECIDPRRARIRHCDLLVSLSVISDEAEIRKRWNSRRNQSRCTRAPILSEATWGRSGRAGVLLAPRHGGPQRFAAATATGPRGCLRRRTATSNSSDRHRQRAGDPFSDR